jgi:DNA polymerase III epsilon subunit-like protein
MHPFIVIDLETLGVPSELPTGYLPEITQIGAVFVPDWSAPKTDWQTLDLFPEPGNGVCTPGSVLWWMEQVAAGNVPRWLRVRQAKGTALDSMATCLHLLRQFVAQREPRPGKPVLQIWGNDPEMDLSPLEGQFKLAKQTVPWVYYNRDDVRTIRNWYAEKSRPAAHDALTDAIDEARLLIELRKRGSLMEGKGA